MPRVPEAGRFWQAVIYLRSSFWFVPGCMLLAAIAMALGLVEIDQRLDQDLRQDWPRLFANEAEGARTMLSAIATSMVTVAGVVFSITIVALAQAATQYTSRVLRNFMRDRFNQVVLGVFGGVFTYSLIVLRSIREGGGEVFVPSLAVLGGLVLAIVAIGFLIAFIHHISSALQAGEIVHGVVADTRKTLDRMFPEDCAKAPGGRDASAGPEGIGWQPVAADETGYVQSVSPDALLEFAIRHDTVVRMEAGVGEFVASGQPIAHLVQDHAVTPDCAAAFNRLYAVGPYRTTDRDPAYGFRQLVDIALKGLSPAINDTTTAATCVDHIAVLLARVAPRELEPPHRWQGGRRRVIARGTSFKELVDLSFAQILENAAGNTDVALRLLRMAEDVAVAARSPERRQLLGQWVGVIEEVAMQSAKSSHARSSLQRSAERAREACSGAGPTDGAQSKTNRGTEGHGGS